MSQQIKGDDKAARLREMRGRGLVARDAVRRDDKGYVVSELSIRNGGREREYRVGKDENGKLICTCAGFRVEVPSNSDFACEHIYAARLWQQQHAELGDIWRNGDEVAQTEGKAMVKAQEVEAKLNGSNEQQQTTCVVTNVGGEVQQEFSNVLWLLRHPVDERLIRVREGWTDRAGRKHLVKYIEWHTVADLLDCICPSWSHSVKSISQIGETVAVVASLTVGGITREGVGTGTGSNETGIKKAEHDALKRAAVKFGIARDLYQREVEAGADVEGKANRSSKPFVSDAPINDPVAKGMNDLITPKQLGMIRRLAQDLHLDAEAECQAMYQCKVEDLNKRAASKLIETLMNRAEMSKQPMARAS